MKVTVKVGMFNLPNFLKLESVPSSESGSMDVGHLFPTDSDAMEFWQECEEAWVKHVQKRRKALSDNATESR